MFVSIMCNMQARDIFRELSDRANGEISKFTNLLFNFMVHVLHKMPYDRRRKAYCLPQMIKRPFQHELTAFFCDRSIRRLPKMSIALAAPKPKPPSNHNFVSKSLERPHSSS